MRPVGLLLLLKTLKGCLPQDIHVSQIPVINTRVGSTVILPCNYTLNIKNSTAPGWYDWYRHVPNGPKVSDDSEDFKGRISKVSNDNFMDQKRADIELKDVMLSDTGNYICQVSFVSSMVISAHGNGTFINVSESTENIPAGNTLTVSLSAGAAVLIILISVAGYLAYTNKGFHSNREEGPIVYTDFTEPRIDNFHMPSQEWQNTENQLYNGENFQNTYAEFLDNSRIHIPQKPRIDNFHMPSQEWQNKENQLYNGENFQNTYAEFLDNSRIHIPQSNHETHQYSMIQ
ncbi:natural cytotoxicity triggering receptor 3-like [Xenopus laevis]|uniref:Natural cytotoxicity triggering receptor 3 n=2 Tax=Xenopus laevis TaxID=8355 RepID=A0A1L8GP59_XENLA|nr:natural cytotoxicity triggering receptor 3-like [Xenopus laevis]OCT85623.1 hypothetical protein XELAEV_18023794mg [Xenopus laevis]